MNKFFFICFQIWAGPSQVAPKSLKEQKEEFIKQLKNYSIFLFTENKEEVERNFQSKI